MEQNEVFTLDYLTIIDAKEGNLGDKVKLGIITVSDRASSGEYQDEGGPAILDFFREALLNECEVFYSCVSDDSVIIQDELKKFCDELQCDVVVTTGGTGPAKRDVTPEATEAILNKVLPGFGEQMRAISLAFVPTAILSRQLGGVRGSSLVFNLPGRPKSIRETIDEIWRAVPYCVDLIDGAYIHCNKEVCNDFRPKSAIRQS